jgi:hypothetical protein
MISISCWYWLFLCASVCCNAKRQVMISCLTSELAAFFLLQTISVAVLRVFY